MYDVLKSLYNAQFLKIYDHQQLLVEIPTKGIETTFAGESIVIKETPFNEEWNDYYNNIVLDWDSPITILQDYGDNCAGAPVNCLTVPKELVLGYSNSSVGFYKNRVVYFQETKDSIVGTTIGNIYFSINVNELRQKRPYDLELYISSDYTLDSPVKCCLSIQYAEKPNKRLVWDLEGVKYGDFVHPDCISQMIDRLYIPTEFRSDASSQRYITRNYLINQGFSFDAKDKSWFKGDKRIWEESCTNDELNLYFYRNPEKKSKDIIFRKEDL